MLTIENLAQLGITKEELLDRITKQTVNQLLNYESSDDEGRGWPVDTKFNKEMQELILLSLREQVQVYFRQAVLPQLIEVVEKMILKRTSRFGETKGKQLTMKEYMTRQVKNFLRENVDGKGQPAPRTGRTRLSLMLDEALQKTLKLEAESVLQAANETLAGELQDALCTRLTQLAAKFQLKVGSR